MTRAGKALRRGIRWLPIPGAVSHVDTKEPLVALTFDDGPDPSWTPAVFEVLEEHEAAATFFMVGSAAARRPDLVERASRAGHVVANHTWDHPVLPRIPLAEVRRQILRCQRALAPWAGRLFRPPYLAQSEAALLLTRMLRFKAVLANVDSGDWWDPDGDRIAGRLSDAVKPGDIVLLHDGLAGFSGLSLPHTPRPDRGAMLVALDRFLRESAGRHRFVTVPDLLAHGKPVRAKRYSRGPKPSPAA